MDYNLIFDNWLSCPTLEAGEMEELNSIALNDEEKKQRFGKTLEFGTAGMRGVMGLGTNMMNVYTVKRATQGVCEYIKSLGSQAKNRGLVVCYDTRNNSELFARTAGGVAIANGVKLRIFSSPSPVPMLSYAVRKFNAVMGIMITASHNPKEYNGYKVYGEDGAQLNEEASAAIMGYMEEVKDYFSTVAATILPFSQKRDQANVEIIKKSFFRSYIKQVLKQSLSRNIVRGYGRKLKVVYTPLHGSGLVPVEAVLKKMKINFDVVEQQREADGNFPTVEVPNPENKEALKMGMALADKVKADMVFGTDPDCDRLGVAIRDKDGEFMSLTGNQTGILLLDYILLRLKESKELPDDAFAVKSFVTTGMAQAICDNYKVKLYDVPVGFKYIGEKIREAEVVKSGTFVFGFEESCGYLRGTYARDKDAVVAAMLFAEMTCYYASRGKSVYERLCSLYEKYDYVLDATKTVKFDGVDALEKMNAVVDGIRQIKIDKIDIYNVLATRDYLSGIRTTADGEQSEIGVHKNNSYYFELDNGTFIAVRPSGTEPKLKVYYSVRAKDKEHAEKVLARLESGFNSGFGLFK